MSSFFEDVFRKYSFEKKKLIVIVAVALLSLVVGMKGFISRDLKEIRTQRIKVAEFTKKQAAINQSADANNQMESYRDLVAVQGQTQWALDAVNKAAGESGLLVISASPQASEKGESFEKNSLMIEARGEYHQVGVFMEKIENHKPWILLTHIRLEKSQESSSAKQLNAFILLSFYYQSDGAPA